MGFVVIIVFILVIIGFIFISVKVNNLKYRAKQHILKDSGASSSDITAGISSAFETKHLQKFLAEHPNFTEESIRELLKQYTVQIFNRNLMNEFSQTVCEKMQKDSKLEKMQGMDFRRANIISYGNSKLNAVVIYTDYKDEYNIYLSCSVLGDKIQLDQYRIAKGEVVGF